MDFIVSYSTDQIETIEKWFNETGGISVWGSLNLSTPGKTYTTPLDGSRPHWSCPNEPEVTITDSAFIGVVSYKEVKRIHVSTRLSGNGLSYKLTDKSHDKLMKALHRAGDNSTYRFDYETQEAIIMVPEKVVSLQEWMTHA